MTPDEQKKFDTAMKKVGAQVDAGMRPMVAVHVLYEELTVVGFTENQACKIIGVMFATNGGNNGSA